MTMLSKSDPGGAWGMTTGWTELSTLAVDWLPICERAATPSATVRSTIARRTLALLFLENLFLLSTSPGQSTQPVDVEALLDYFLEVSQPSCKIKTGMATDISEKYCYRDHCELKGFLV